MRERFYIESYGIWDKEKGDEKLSWNELCSTLNNLYVENEALKKDTGITLIGTLLKELGKFKPIIFSTPDGVVTLYEKVNKEKNLLENQENHAIGIEESYKQLQQVFQDYEDIVHNFFIENEENFNQELKDEITLLFDVEWLDD